MSPATNADVVRATSTAERGVPATLRVPVFRTANVTTTKANSSKHSLRKEGFLLCSFKGPNPWPLGPRLSVGECGVTRQFRVWANWEAEAMDY